MSLDGLAADWGVGEQDILRVLHQLGDIPLIVPKEGGKRYVSLWPLEMALFEAGLPIAAKGSQDAVRAIHASAGIVYGSLGKEAIRSRLQMLQRALSKPGPHTIKDPSKKSIKVPKTRSR